MFIKIILRIISSFVMYGLSWHEFWYELLMSLDNGDERLAKKGDIFQTLI